MGKSRSPRGALNVEDRAASAHEFIAEMAEGRARFPLLPQASFHKRFEYAFNLHCDVSG